MEKSVRSLAALTLACALAATIFGFGSDVFSFRSVYAGHVGREALIQTARLLVYVALGVLLVFQGGWRGVVAALFMVVVATAAEWALLSTALGFASIPDPSGYERRFAGFTRPPYERWALWDILSVGGAAAFSWLLIRIAHFDPTGPRDG